MANRYCPKCSTNTGGFAFCSSCGGATIEFATEQSQVEKSFESSSNPRSRQIALWCHLAPLLISVFAGLTAVFFIGFVLALLAWIPPLVIKGSNSEDDFVVSHAKESFNFQIFWLITTFVLLFFYLIFGVLTLGIGLIVGAVFLLIIILPLIIFLVIVQIQACMAASAGRSYKYPLVIFRVMK